MRKKKLVAIGIRCPSCELRYLEGEYQTCTLTSLEWLRENGASEETISKWEHIHNDDWSQDEFLKQMALFAKDQDIMFVVLKTGKNTEELKNILLKIEGLGVTMFNLIEVVADDMTAEQLARHYFDENRIEYLENDQESIDSLTNYEPPKVEVKKKRTKKTK